MIEKIISEVSKEGSTKVSRDVPAFGKDMKPNEISNFKEANQPLDRKCRNHELAEREHPVTAVPFKEKVIEHNGEKIRGVYPEFPSKFSMNLDEFLYTASDRKQFQCANKELKEGVEKDPKLASKFSKEQLEQIKEGQTPDRNTWHHHEEPGKMQLVNSELHAKTGHDGGKSEWGGGSENR